MPPKKKEIALALDLPKKKDGFEGQRSINLPQTKLKFCAQHIFCRNLHITDIGYYPWQLFITGREKMTVRSIYSFTVLKVKVGIVLAINILPLKQMIISLFQQILNTNTVQILTTPGVYTGFTLQAILPNFILAC